MGSVSDDYRCPWCGRIGNGGYALDYPICTGGDFACLSRVTANRNLTPRRVIGDQLVPIFRSRHQNKDIWYAVAEFLVDPRTVGRVLTLLSRVQSLANCTTVLAGCDPCNYTQYHGK